MTTETIRKANKNAASKDEVINIRAIIITYLSYWPYTIGCLLLCFTIAYFFLKRAKPSYQIKATVVLQGNANNKANDNKQQQDINITNFIPVNVEDEIELLRSRNLTSLAIDSLQLNITYALKTVPVSDPMYKTGPIKLELITIKPDLDRQNFEVTIKDNSSYVVKFKDKQQEFLFKDTIAADMGHFKISPTNNISKYIGSTISVEYTSPDNAIKDILDALEVTQKFKLASTVELAISDKIFQRGQDYINALIFFYNQAKNEEKNRNTKNNLLFIDNRLDSLKKELDEAENIYENFRSKRKITDINAQAQISRQNQQNNDIRLNETNLQLKVINEVENYVNSSNQQSRNPSTIGIQDPGLVTLVQRYAELQQERAKLLANIPEKNPIFEPLNRQIENTRAAIRENIRNIKLSLQATKSGLTDLSARYDAAIQTLPREEGELNELRREQTIKDNLYNILLVKKEELSLSASTVLSSATIIDRAYSIPLKGISRMVAYGGALVAGFALPAIFAIVFFLLRNKITSTVDIEELGIPVIGEINRIKKIEPPLVFLYPKRRKITTIIEQFRSLRNELYHLHNNNSKGHVTLITSSTNKEGKTFIASNLALALASAEKKTILIDMDLFNPNTASLLDIYTATPGITGYLRHQAQIQDIIIPTTISPDLDIIEAGVYVENYSELLEQQLLENLISWLKLRYDHILIKASPRSIVNDASVIGRLCDVTLYIITYDYTSKAFLPFIKKVYLDNYMPKMHVVFNKKQK